MSLLSSWLACRTSPEARVRLPSSNTPALSAALEQNGERGQSVAEFSLVVPVLGLVLFALIEFGLMFNSQVSVVNAARNGARTAAMFGTNPDGTPVGSSTLTPMVQQAVTDAANSRIDCSLQTPTVVPTYRSGSGQVADWTVTADCVYTPITPLAPLFRLFGSTTSATYTITQSATMRDINCVPYPPQPCGP